MKFSVIVPAYNRAHTLPLCINSLLCQDYPKELFEIIIVDNNSVDNTKDLIIEYAKQTTDLSITYVLENRKGLVYARHSGADSARHETLVYTDDDAVLSPNWLSAIAEVYKLNPDVAAVGTKIVIRWDDTPPDWVIEYEPLLGRLDYGGDILIKRDIFINGGSFSIRKHILKSVGGFNPDQIGDRLIGDGETGLCRKLHERDYLIGWTPVGVMQHLQFVQRNATIKDIKRRYYNNGIGVPYRMFVFSNASRLELLTNLINLIKSILRKLFQSVYYCFKSTNEKKKLELIFEIEYLKSQVTYILRVSMSAAFRRQICRTDWY